MAPRRAKQTLDDAFDTLGQRPTCSKARISRTTARKTLSQARSTHMRNGKARVSSSKKNAAPADTSKQIGDAGSSGDDMYEVASMIKEKEGHFFVKWAGYDSDEITWEPERNLKAQMVKRFRERIAAVRSERNLPIETGQALHDEDDQAAILEGALSPPRRLNSASAINTDEISIIGAHVILLLSEEEWMSSADYGSVGSAYLTGVISREYVEKGKKRPSSTNSLFELRWPTTQFQMGRHVHGIPRSKVLEGISRYNQLSGNELRDETWDVLCRPYHDAVESRELWDEFEAISKDFARYDWSEVIPGDVGEVERVSAMEFQPRAVQNAPDDLFERSDGSTSPYVK